MKRRGKRMRVAAVVVVLGSIAAGRPASTADVLVFAASSTTDAVIEINGLFSRGGDRAVASFGSSGTLARQIENGAPAELFISADRAWIAHLDRRKLIRPAGGRVLFANRLSLIAPTDSTVALTLEPGVALRRHLGDGRLALADPAHTPAGEYARAALQSLSIWADIAARTIRARDVRAALAVVERGEAPLGIVYSTDAAISRRVRTVALVPAHLHPPIRYYAALVSETETPAGRRYFDLLFSARARAVFRRHGFDADGLD